MWSARTFTELDAERLDDLGFLDRSRSPRLRPAADLLSNPVAWVLGRPWIGKSTVARGLETHLRFQPELVPGLDDRVWLTRLNLPAGEGGGLPFWWDEWRHAPVPSPAIWLVDGVDESLDTRADRLDQLGSMIEAIGDEHLRELRLVLFSRPYSELEGFRRRLRDRYKHLAEWDAIPQFWLTRLDRAAAATIVTGERFTAVEHLIRRNSLQPVAGYPVVLRYLATYHRDAEGLTVASVWQGVLSSLLGERQSNSAVCFQTTREERFRAARRIAAVLTLSRTSAVREYSPAPGQPTIDTLFHAPDSRVQAAVREACRSALFTPSGDPLEYRFVQRNAQDWLTAFALNDLPRPALRSALSSSGGTLSPRLREVARLLRTALGDNEARDVIDRLAGGPVLPSDATVPTADESLTALDQLERLAIDSPWGLRFGQDGENLGRLRAEGLGVALAARLRDPNRPARVKHLLIDVAEATAAIEAADAAVELVLDPTQEDELRYAAVWMVNRLGGDLHLQMLEIPVGEGTGTAEIDCRLRATVVLQCLRRRGWTCARAALNAPPMIPGLTDTPHTLLNQIEDQMLLADARQLLPHLRVLWDRHATEHRPFDLPKFLDRAVSLVLGVSPPDASDLNALIHFVQDVAGDDGNWLRAREITQRLRPFQAARRSLYLLEMTADERRRAMAFHLLPPEDWEWARDQALGPLAGRRDAWEQAEWVAWTARQSGQISDADWTAFTELLETHAPGLRASFNLARQQYEQQQAQAEARRREEEARNPRRRPLRERVEELLARQDVPEQEVMRGLGWMCFSPDPWSRDVAGEVWGDLQPELQRRVLQACRCGLIVTDPTPIPNSGTFSGRILFEGGAFAAVVTGAEAEGWLTPDLIRRWLPSALFARMSEDWDGPITACATVCPHATEVALLDTIELHAHRAGSPFLLRQIPGEAWTPALTDRLVTLAADETILAPVRRELLDQLATRDPSRIDPIATAWANRPVAEGDIDQLRVGGRNILIRRNPLLIFDLLENEFDSRGAACLEELPNLYDDSLGWTAGVRNWPLAHLERLVTLLVRAYPPAADPPEEGGFVTPDIELRMLRGQIIWTLLGRTDPEAVDVMERLSALDSHVRARRDTHLANARAAELLPRITQPGSDPDALSVQQAVRLLNREGFRLIRSADDLLDAIIEALGKIGDSIGHDLPMLYSAYEKDQPRRHLHEDALQAYLRLRLTDQLAHMCDGVAVQIVREDQIGFRQRLDLRVTAPCHGGGGFATVVVEVKWSTHQDTNTAQVDQLGVRYLLGEGLSHGVFLVGWVGLWRPRDGSGENHSRVTLHSHLITQRDAFCAPGQPGAQLRIEPFILDARWSRSDS